MNSKTSLVDNIEILIKNGLINGYKENILFTQNYFDLQSRIIEYLIVVNVAKELLQYCIQNGMEINLEHSLNDFYNNAFPSVIFSGGFFSSKALKRKNHTPEDSKTKRLDIVLTSEMSNEGELGFPSKKSIFGIEIKAINQSNKKIKQDIIRLSKALNLKDPISNNYIKAGFACFFKRFDREEKILSREAYEVKAKKEVEKWQSYFEELGKIYKELRFTITEIKVTNLPVEEFVFHTSEIQYDYSEVAQSTGFINAYIIKIDRNE